MLNQLRSALVVFAILTAITGIIYPLVITGAAQVVFPHAANGSLIESNGKVVGSELIGQSFDDPKLFWGRPSATSPAYNGASSTGSNLGPTNPAQLDAVKSRVDMLRKAHTEMGDVPIPVDLLTASGSGLDPHISPAAAEYQVKRVARIAKTRGVSEERIRELVAEQTEGRTFGVLGEPRVNVLKLNLALNEALKKGGRP